jgi:hypothetical protein
METIIQAEHNATSSSDSAPLVVAHPIETLPLGEGDRFRSLVVSDFVHEEKPHVGEWRFFFLGIFPVNSRRGFSAKSGLDGEYFAIFEEIGNAKEIVIVDQCGTLRRANSHRWTKSLDMR